MMPFSTPSVRCCSRKPVRVRGAMKRVTLTESGMISSVTTASGTFMANMAISVPTRLTALATSCVAPWERTAETLSTSLVRRLISSPCGCRSKKRSGKSCSRPKRSVRRSRTVYWEMAAMSQICSQATAASTT